MGATEFTRWRLRILQEQEDEWTKTSKEDWYMARLTYEVHILRYVVMNMFAKSRTKLEKDTIKDFLIEFETAKKERFQMPEREPETEEAARARVSSWSKAKWFAGVGYDPSRKVK